MTLFPTSRGVIQWFESLPLADVIAKGPAHAPHLVHGDEVRLPDVVKAGSIVRGACRNWSSSRGAVVVEPFFNIAEVVFVPTVPLYSKPNRRVKQDGKVDPLCLLPYKVR